MSWGIREGGCRATARAASFLGEWPHVAVAAAAMGEGRQRDKGGVLLAAASLRVVVRVAPAAVPFGPRVPS